MAVFATRAARKVYLDDTQQLTFNFENAQTVKGHTEYIIRVHRGPTPDKSWYVYKRYNDFVALHTMLQVSGINIPLPPKKLIGNMDRTFITERQSALQNYLKLVLMNPILASSLGVRKFLDPENYVLSFQEIACQHVSMALRSEADFEFYKQLPDIGWRLRKHYFLVKPKHLPHDEMLLSYADYGPDKHIEDKELQAMFKCLINLNHPYIEKIYYSHCGDSGAFVIREYFTNGSLRDHICQAKPKSQFLKKYGSPKQTSPLTAGEIAYFGHQILVALIFLHEKGLPYGHLHLGNIVVYNNNVHLLDIENGVLGLPSYYRPFFIQFKKINCLEAVDVYSFGHVLYEMAFGSPLHESVCDNIPACPELLRALLESILSSRSLKTGLPTLNELTSHPFFNSASISSHNRIAFKFPSNLREHMKEAVDKIERRLRDEQKVVRQQKKMAKVQELLSTEEEMKKRKTRLKEERKANHCLKQANGNNKSPPRSDSPTSTSTATSAGTVTPPPVLTVKSISPNVEHSVDGRSALLDSICNFNKSKLKPSELS